MTRSRTLHPLVGCLLALAVPTAGAQQPAGATTAPGEEAYYRIETVPIPEGVVLEVGGLATLPDGSLGVSTRRGEVWVVENPSMKGGTQPHFRRFAQGLHEPLGLAFRDGALYAAQRGEVTRLVDENGDGRADRYETIHRWPLSGNYHEYSYGPVFDRAGNMIVTLNLAWIGRGASLAPWRGWALQIDPKGEMTPFATGMRSPAGFGHNLAGDLFYADNQGDWVGSGGITHVEKGDFVGNPAGLRWASDPRSPIRLREEDVPDTGEPKHVVAQRLPALKTPAVWFPHTLLGISTSAILVDSTGGDFGPFTGQLFVGDQGHSKIMRVFLEKVDGVYQGAAFPFREGFASGVLRQEWGRDGSMFVGMTSRGWKSTGPAPYALQRLVWTGAMPFEAHRIEARPDGFEVTFTKPVDVEAAANPASCEVSSFTYKYHHVYGSPPVETAKHPVRAVRVSRDGRSARLLLDSLRVGFIHEVKMAGVRSASGDPLLHGVGYYTVNRIPRGPRMAPVRMARGESGAVRPRAAAATSGRPAGGTPMQAGAAPAPTAGQPTTAPAGVAVTGDPGAASTAGAAANATTVAVAKRQTAMPADFGGAVDRTVNLGTLPGLKFDVQEIRVKAGSRVRVAFTNDDDMLHNFVVVAPGTVDRVALEAMAMGIQGPERNYVPETPAVLHHTRLLQPGERESIYFRAPTAPGRYTYVCTFPGHGQVMRGVLVVEA